METAEFDPKLPLPNFFIVGAVKCGTTSLYAYLSQHPEVFMSPVKEPHFFAPFEYKSQFDNFVAPILDPGNYQRLFAGAHAGVHKAIGEASPSYLCNADTPARIKARIRNPRIVISLRNPVQRAFSHYLMEYHRGRETLPFREAIVADEARAEKGWGVSFQYVDLGLYSNQVKRYIDTFGRERVLVILFEDMTTDPQAVMSRVATFLGVDATAFPEQTFLEVHNKFEASRGLIARSILHSRVVRLWSRRLLPKSTRVALRNSFLVKPEDRPVLSDEMRMLLSARFADDVRQLERLLGEDLSKLQEVANVDVEP